MPIISEILKPESLTELQDAVCGAPRLVPVGAGTKTRLSGAEEGVTRVSLQGLSGVVEYEPDEYTFTALAGTPIAELIEILSARGQYLPWDPMLVAAGATLGGTVAAGLSGPGRFRFGGLRDFILGVRLVDGSGRLLRLGGKVVKNAAGFDLPKFLVGSLGRFGVLAELTFKVFPRPSTSRTLRLAAADPEAATRMLSELGGGRWELEAMDVPPGDPVLLVRLAGPTAALPGLIEEILRRWPGTELPSPAAAEAWTELGEFRWAHPTGWLGKVILDPAQWPQFHRTLRGVIDSRVHLSSGGNVAYVSLADPGDAAGFNERWRGLGVRSLTLRGPGPLWLGERRPSEIEAAVKTALDPENRFPSLDE